MVETRRAARVNLIYMYSVVAGVFFRVMVKIND